MTAVRKLRVVTRSAPLSDAHPYAVGLRDACRRLGISVRTGERLIADGRFPIPALPDLGVRRLRFSTSDIDQYLTRASTNDL